MTDYIECPSCGQTDPDPECTGLCAGCRAANRAPQGESVRLFEPAPAQMPGQIEMYGGLPVNPLAWPKHLL